MWILLCIFGLVSLGQGAEISLADQMAAATQRCCSQGTTYAKLHSSEDCSSSIPPEVPSMFGALCIFAMDQCCKEFIQKKRDCIAGDQAASNLCENTENTEKICCAECVKGQKVGTELGIGACTIYAESTIADTILAGEAFVRCCKKAAYSQERTHESKKTLENMLSTGSNATLTQAQNAVVPLSRMLAEKSAASLCEEYAPNELCAHHCIPVPGSYRCECNPGFMLMADGRNCIEVVKNRCKPKNSCQHKCNDNGIEVKCSCRRGYQLKADGKSCEDINECLLEPAVCLPSTECYNVQGSYKCIPKKNQGASDKGQCPAGFYRNSKNNVCDDINECKLLSPPCPPYLCENTVGGYKCGGVSGDPANLDEPKPAVNERCPPGFKAGYYEECEDVDECALQKDDCNHISQFCINTRGSFYCQNKVSKHCPPGFKINPTTNMCEDINECEDGQDICRHDQICVNVPGEYDCKPKYEHRRSSDKCPEGTRLRRGAVCEDIDECLEGTHLCDAHQNCLNTNGSHECHCKFGFEIDPITGGCVDVNECATDTHNCIPGSQRCDNTIGSFLCMRLTSCGTGYILQASTSQCEDIDECALGTHNCMYAGPEWKCENHPGSFRCVRSRPSTTPAAPPEYEYEYYDSGEEEGYNKSKEYKPEVNPEPKQKPERTTTTAIVPTILPPRLDETFTPSQRPLSISNDQEENKPQNPFEAQLKPEQASVEEDTHRTMAQPEHNHPELQQSNQQKHQWRQPDQQYNQMEPDQQSNQRQPDSQSNQRQPDPQSNQKQPNQQSNQQQPDQKSNERQPDQQSNQRQPDQHSNQRQPGQESNQRQPDQKSNQLQPDQESNERQPNQHSNLGQPGQESNQRQPDQQSNQRQPDQESHQAPPNQVPDNHKYEFQKPGSPYKFTPNYYITDQQPEFTLDGQNSVPSPTPHMIVVNVRKQTATVEGEKKDDGSVVVDTKNVPQNKWTNISEKPTDCRFGFEKDQNGVCVDIDECASRRHSCSGLTEICRNTIGGYICVCAANFRRDLTTGDCLFLITTSSTTTSTEPTPTGKNRDMFWGYPKYQTVTTRPFRPRTLCDVGYHFNAQTEKCEDIDECTNGQANCASVEICVNTDGGYRCECPPNWKLDEVRHRCVSNTNSGTFPTGYGNEPDFPVYTPPSSSEVQQTFENHKVLEPEVSTLGNSRSVISCPVGYKLGSDNTCEDIDECSSEEARCRGGMLCTNLPGGYVCSCPAGHRLVDSQRCEDVDECSLGGHMPICSQNADCVNTVGSYQCKCHAGFRSAAANDKVCVDVDECTESPPGSLCQHRCNNVWGGYKCTCHRGYRLNADNRTCSDVDECTEFKSKILCVGRCVNEPGSYKCTCPKGYKLSEDKRSCIDIDECETGVALCASGGTSSGSSDVCLNTRGGYRCHRISCPQGYKLESKHRCTRVEKVCSPADWECAHQPTTYSYNFITFVSNLYIPDSKVDLFTMRGPNWPNANMRFQLRLVNVDAPPSVKRKADINSFLLVHTGNQAVMSLVRSLEGPQSIELELSMELYNGEQFGGIAIARLYIYVSEFEF